MRDDHTGAILVARIMRGGAADRSGELQPVFILTCCSHVTVQFEVKCEHDLCYN